MAPTPCELRQNFVLDASPMLSETGRVRERKQRPSRDVPHAMSPVSLCVLAGPGSPRKAAAEHQSALLSVAL